MHQRFRNSLKVVFSLAIGVSILGTQAMAQSDSVNQNKTTETATFRVPKTDPVQKQEDQLRLAELPPSVMPKHPLDRAVRAHVLDGRESLAPLHELEEVGHHRPPSMGRTRRLVRCRARVAGVRDHGGVGRRCMVVDN